MPSPYETWKSTSSDWVCEWSNIRAVSCSEDRTAPKMADPYPYTHGDGPYYLCVHHWQICVGVASTSNVIEQAKRLEACVSKI